MRKLVFTLLVCTMTLPLAAQDLKFGTVNSYDNSDPCKFSIDLTYNNGGNDYAGQHTSNLYLTQIMAFANPPSDILVGGITTPSLVAIAPGGSVTFDLQNVDLSQVPGVQSGVKYYLYLAMDVFDDVNESNESNNLHEIDTVRCTFVGREESFAIHNLALFPNPAADRLAVEFSAADASVIRWEITDLLGREMRKSPELRVQSGVQSVAVDLADLPAGTYLLRLYSDDGMLARRFRVRR